MVRFVPLIQASSLLTVGFSSGIFGLYELPDFNDIHTLRCVRPL
jgi:periodic tryptophan protein 2